MIIPSSNSAGNTIPPAIPPPLPMILVVGLNPALQKQLILPDQGRLVPGNVHRAESVRLGVGGKGQDVAIALQGLGVNYGSRCQLLQFIGQGSTGDLMSQLLAAQLQEIATTDGDATDDPTVAADDPTAAALTVRVASALRTCTTIVAAETATEFVEPSGCVTEAEVEDLLTNKLTPYLHDPTTPTITALCLMGSLPPMPPPIAYEVYARIYHKVVTATPSTLCVVDSLVGIEPLLIYARTMQTLYLERRSGSSGAGNKESTPCTGGAIVLKITAAELCQLVGTALQTTTTSSSRTDVTGIAPSGGISMPSLAEAIVEFQMRYKISCFDQHPLIGLAITDGPHPAYFVAFEKDQHEAGINNGPRTEDEIDYDQLRFTMYKYSVPSLVGHGTTTTTSSSTTTNTNSTDEEEKEHTKLVLYPIGAGDAVAGGTIAAWTSLTTAAAAATAAPSTSSSSILSDACFNLVQDFCHKQQINPTRTHHTATTILQQQQQDALASFAFGLACGSASCLQPENSVVKERDVLRLFPQIVIDKY